MAKMTKTAVSKAASAKTPSGKSSPAATHAAEEPAGKILAKARKPGKATLPAPVPEPASAKAAKSSKGKVAPPSPSEKPKTITINQMAIVYAQKHEIVRKEAAIVLSEVFDTVAQHVKDGDKVRIPGIGTIEVRNRPARKGRNPATGESIQIAASRKIVFRAAKELKETV